MSGLRLVQEWQEPRDYVVDHIRLEVGYDTSGQFSLPGSVVERYLHGELEAHVHWALGIDGLDEVSRYYCARFAYGEYLHRDDVEVVAAEAHAALYGRADGVQKPVPVDAGQLVEQPQGVRSITLRPEDSRLQFLDDCLRIWVDELGVLGVDPIDSPRWWISPPDWERDILSLVVAERTRMRDGQLEREVIERRTKVLKRVSDDGREVWWVRHPAIGDHRLPGLAVTLTDEGTSVAFLPTANTRVEQARMFVRAIQLSSVTADDRSTL